MPRKTSPPGRGWMNILVPSLGLAFALLCIVALVAMLAGCARPTRTITFQAWSEPDSAGMIITVDVALTKGSFGEGTTYPQEYAPRKAFIHFQVAEIGTVGAYSILVLPVEPGQVVHCLTSENGLITSQKSTASRSGVACTGGPV